MISNKIGFPGARIDLGRYVPPGVADFDFTHGYLDPRFTFSRSTTSTYIDDSGVLRTAAINEPVFEGGALRLEPQATNVIANNAFTTSNMQATYGYDSPDGGKNARLLTASVVQAATVFYRLQAESYVGTRVFSFFCKKAASHHYVIVKTGAGPAGVSLVIDIDTDQVVHNAAQTDVVMLETKMLGDGWKRYSFACQEQGINGYYGAWPCPQNATAETNVTTDGTEQALMFGYALETGSVLTSYIPTTTAAATRASDNMSIQGQAFADVFNQDEGAIVIDYDVQVRGTSDTPYTDRLLALGDSTKADPFRFYMNGSVLGLYSDQVGNGVTVVQPFQTGRFKLGLAWRDGNVNVFAQGAKKISSFAMFSAPNKLTLYGLTAASWAPMTNYRVRQFAQRPTDAQLQAMTAP